MLVPERRTLYMCSFKAFFIIQRVTTECCSVLNVFLRHPDVAGSRSKWLRPSLNVVRICCMVM